MPYALFISSAHLLYTITSQTPNPHYCALHVVHHVYAFWLYCCLFVCFNLVWVFVCLFVYLLIENDNIILIVLTFGQAQVLTTAY